MRNFLNSQRCNFSIPVSKNTHQHLTNSSLSIMIFSNNNLISMLFDKFNKLLSVKRFDAIQINDRAIYFLFQQFFISFQTFMQSYSCARKDTSILVGFSQNFKISNFK